MLELPRVSRLTWLEAVSHELHGAPHQQMRHTLMTLSLHMNGAGQTSRKFPPSQEKLGRRALLNARVVRRHLAGAEASGWIMRKEIQRHGGRNWKQTLYFATVPATFPESELRARGADWVTAPYDEVRTGTTKGADRNDEKVRTGGPTIPLKESLSKKSLLEAAGAQEKRAPLEPGPQLPPALANRLKPRRPGGAS